jgi:hypothetical protein
MHPNSAQEVMVYMRSLRIWLQISASQNSTIHTIYILRMMICVLIQSRDCCQKNLVFMDIGTIKYNCFN